MANLSSEQEELLKEIKSTFNGDTEENAFEESKAEAVEPAAEEAPSDNNDENVSKNESDNTEPDYDEPDYSDLEDDESLDPISDGTTDVLKEKPKKPSADYHEDWGTTVKPASKSMPKYGPGFKYVPIISAVTVIAIVLGHIGPFVGGVITNKTFRYIYIGFGVAILAWGISLILNAINECAILINAQMGKLVTTGVYSKTRNPMYTGVTFICTGALFISGNAFVFFLPVLFWLFMSYLMTNTEEELLEKTFGQDYLDYKNETNRFLPFKKHS